MFVFYSIIKELERHKMAVTGVPETRQEASVPEPPQEPSVSGATTDRAVGPDAGSSSSGEYFKR